MSKGYVNSHCEFQQFLDYCNKIVEVNVEKYETGYDVIIVTSSNVCPAVQNVNRVTNKGSE